jgi:hypothetical protein
MRVMFDSTKNRIAWRRARMSLWKLYGMLTVLKVKGFVIPVSLMQEDRFVDKFHK